MFAPSSHGRCSGVCGCACAIEYVPDFCSRHVHSMGGTQHVKLFQYNAHERKHDGEQLGVCNGLLDEAICRANPTKQREGCWQYSCQSIHPVDICDNLCGDELLAARCLQSEYSGQPGQQTRTLEGAHSTMCWDFLVLQGSSSLLEISKLLKAPCFAQVKKVGRFGQRHSLALVCFMPACFVDLLFSQSHLGRPLSSLSE